ncbi:MAG: fimbrial assembly protein [Methylomarinum sp.]|nr:fimbrial assembly protein [Methylomarinum sp.]
MNLKTEIDFDLKRFFQWWGRELSNCLPEKIRQKLSEQSGYVFLSVNNAELQFEQILDGTLHKLTTFSLNEASADSYQQFIVDNTELEKVDYVLRLNIDQAIKKILYLPAAAKENLRQVIAFELDRLTPFNVEQVYYSVKILEKEAQGKIKVLLVLTPKDVLDGVLQQLNSAQIYPSVVEYCAATNDFTYDLDPYNLLPEENRPVKDKATQVMVAGLTIIAMVLAISVLIFPVWQQQQEVDSLRQQLRTLHKDTLKVQSQQLEIDQLVEETERLIKVKQRAPGLTELLNLLSQLMPDDTWLTHFKYNKDHLQIQGQSPSASVLISVLEASSIFSNARFVSPLTQDKKTGLERFQIRMDLDIGEIEDE